MLRFSILETEEGCQLQASELQGEFLSVNEKCLFLFAFSWFRAAVLNL